MRHIYYLRRVVFRIIQSAAIVLELSLITASAPAEWHVWTLSETRRVLRDDQPETDQTVSLSAARNEWESFQILMRADEPLLVQAVEAGDLIGPAGAVLAGKDARLFRQHQLHLTLPTERNDAFKPGWYPDALVPFADPLSGNKLPQARYRALPFELPAGETHGFWVDIHVPENAKPGKYQGTYRVVTADGRKITIPVSLTVWDFALPQTTTLQTAFGSPVQRLRSYYADRAKDGKEKEPPDWALIERQCAELLCRHHINAAPPQGSMTPKKQADGPFEISDEQIDEFRRFVDRYHINAFETPHPQSAVKDPIAEKETLKAWLAAWNRAAKKLDRPQVTLFTYLRDEPNNKEDYEYVQKWGRAVCQEKSALKVLVVEQTSPQNEKEWGDLYGAVDIWCPLFSLFDDESACKRQALGETIWTYTALCQLNKTPWWHIDYPLLHYRVPAWIAWRYRIRGLLYWGGLSYWKEVEDPWTDPVTYGGNEKFRKPQRPHWNGEGSLVYPARAVGYEGIVSSMRLKTLRDAIEDYEYLAILERAGRSTEAENIVMPIAGSWYKWDENPAAYVKAREKLAELIQVK